MIAVCVVLGRASRATYYAAMLKPTNLYSRPDRCIHSSSAHKLPVSVPSKKNCQFLVTCTLSDTQASDAAAAGPFFALHTNGITVTAFRCLTPHV
jgi:hypothetical protein